MFAGPTMSTPSPHPFGSMPPPREDLNSGSVNLISTQSLRRPAILLNTQRPRAAAPAPAPPPAAAAAQAMGAYPPTSQPHPMGSYPPPAPGPSGTYPSSTSHSYPSTSQAPAPHPMGSYPPPSSQPPRPSYPPSQSPSWGSYAAPPAWGSYPPSWPTASPAATGSWAPPSTAGSWAPPPSWGPPPSSTAPWGQPPAPAPTPGPWDFYYGQQYWGQPPSAAPPTTLAPQPPPRATGPSKEPPAKIQALAPPGEEDGAPKVKPGYVAAKKGAVIYTIPRPPTPEAPKPVEAMAPHGPVIVPTPQPLPTAQPEEQQPKTYMDVLSGIEAEMQAPPPPAPAPQPEEPKKKQFFYDGESWVYCFEQPPMKKKPEEVLSYEDQMKKAVMENVIKQTNQGKYTLTVKRHHSDKPKVGEQSVVCFQGKLTILFSIVYFNFQIMLR